MIKLTEHRGYSAGIIFGMIGYFLYGRLESVSPQDTFNLLALIIFLIIGDVIAHWIIGKLGDIGKIA